MKRFPTSLVTVIAAAVLAACSSNPTTPAAPEATAPAPVAEVAKPATPAPTPASTVATVVVPASVPPLGLVPMATVMLAVELVTVLLNASCTVTRTAGAMDTPATAVVGWVVNASLAAAAWLMLNADEVAPASGADAAVSV